jgi:hypothetical protein
MLLSQTDIYLNSKNIIKEMIIITTTYPFAPFSTSIYSLNLFYFFCCQITEGEENSNKKKTQCFQQKLKVTIF